MEVTDVQYKESEIGVIPVDWNVKKISDFSKPVRGGSPRPAGSPLYFNGDYIPWLTVAALTNISSSQLFVSETEGFLTQLGSEYSRTLEKDTLIIANSGATLGVAKLLAIKCCANDGIAALNNFSREVDKAYVVYYINSITQKLREVVATGNGQPNLNTTLIGELRIPLPSTKSEQTAIATALSDTDALIENLEKLIAKKRNIKQGVMQELLKPESNWILTSVGEVATIRKGEQLNKDTLTAQGQYPVMNGGIQPSGYTDKWNQNPNTIIISEGGNSCGYVNFIKTRFWQGGHCYSVDAKIHKHFLYHLLKFHEKEIMGLRVGSGLPNIQRNRLIEFSLSIPDREKQHAIALVLDEINEVITAMENKLQKYKMVKQGMMQALLTGKIRLA